MNIDLLIDLLQKAKERGVTDIAGVTPNYIVQAFHGNAPVLSKHQEFLGGDLSVVEITWGAMAGSHLLMGDGDGWKYLSEFKKIEV